MSQMSAFLKALESGKLRVRAKVVGQVTVKIVKGNKGQTEIVLVGRDPIELTRIATPTELKSSPNLKEAILSGSLEVL